MFCSQSYLLRYLASTLLVWAFSEPNEAISGNLDPRYVQVAKQQSLPAGFQRLTSQQIQKLVIELGTASYPDSDQTSGNSDWTIQFKQSRRADRGKANFENATLENYGTWHTKRDKLCIRVKGSDSGFGVNDTTQPHHGCFAVYVHSKKGEVVAYMPRVRMYRFLMAEEVAEVIRKVLRK